MRAHDSQGQVDIAGLTYLVIQELGMRVHPPIYVSFKDSDFRTSLSAKPPRSESGHAAANDRNSFLHLFIFFYHKILIR
jgi:hypothetical protein